MERDKGHRVFDELAKLGHAVSLSTHGPDEVVVRVAFRGGNEELQELLTVAKSSFADLIVEGSVSIRIESR